MKQERRYYINQIPECPNKVYPTLDEAISEYKAFKKSITDHFVSDMALKEEYPDLYNTFMEVELTEKEIAIVTKRFYEESVIGYSDKLTSNDYELE
jgi:hypothetical protein